MLTSSLLELTRLALSPGLPQNHAFASSPLSPRALHASHLLLLVTGPSLSHFTLLKLFQIWNQIQFLCFSPLDDTVLDLVQVIEIFLGSCPVIQQRGTLWDERGLGFWFACWSAAY